MTLYRTPKILPVEEECLEKIRVIWQQLRFALRDKPHRWAGFLRRSALARGIRGSNSIEGYLVSDDDAMAAVELEEPFGSEDVNWSAITGYRDAMTYVLRIGDDPHASVDASLVRSLHFMMLRYDLEKGPGAWRAGPVFVRDEENRRTLYTAPDAEMVPDLMEELVSWIRDESDATSSLIRAAMAHLNLVMIHPFRDGNGRMGRCLQTLILARKGVYDPIFCSVEEHLGSNTRAYYKVLAEVGQGQWNPAGDARPWVRFMLDAHYKQAGTFRRRMNETGAVWSEVEALLQGKGLPERATAPLVEAAFGHRIRNQRYRKHADVTSNLASRDLRDLVKAGLLIAHGERRGRWYERSPALLEIRDAHRDKKPIEDLFAGAE